MRIIVKNASIEAYYFISIIEHYYSPLQQVYSIITIKILGIEPNLVFQISFKAINNLENPNKLVFTLLVFGTYPRIIKQDILSLLITQYVIGM